MSGPVRWGILGSGRVAEGFSIGLAAAPGAELVAVASRRRANAEAFSRRHGHVRVHDDYGALVADPEIDVVYVATPNDRHAEDAIRCLEHGKGVLCEKPFTVAAAEARRVVAAAREHRQFCMEGMWMRFIPAVRRARQLVEDGAIGELRTIHADFSHPVIVDPAVRLFDPASGGGALLDLGVYTLSLAQLFLGEPSDVVSHLSIGPTGVDDHVSLVLGYRSGAVATLTASLRSRGPNRAVLAGSEGVITLPGPICAPTRLRIEPVAEAVFGGDGEPSRLRRVVMSHRRIAAAASGARRAAGRFLPDGPKVARLPLDANGYEYEIGEVVGCLASGRLESSIMPLDDSVRVMEIIEGVRAEHGIG